MFRSLARSFWHALAEAAAEYGFVGRGCHEAGRARLPMPAEWERHARCWMAWPTRTELWGEYLEGARLDHARVAQAIGRFEPVTLVANADEAEDAASRCGLSVKVLSHADRRFVAAGLGTDLPRGPARRARRGGLHLQCLGRQIRGLDQDAAVGERIADAAGVPAYRSSLVVEGGGFLSDGEGTLITAETCVLNPNRNPGLDQGPGRGASSAPCWGWKKSSGCPAT